MYQRSRFLAVMYQTPRNSILPTCWNYYSWYITIPLIICFPDSALVVSGMPERVSIYIIFKQAIRYGTILILHYNMSLKHVYVRCGSPTFGRIRNVRTILWLLCSDKILLARTDDTVTCATWRSLTLNFRYWRFVCYHVTLWCGNGGYFQWSIPGTFVIIETAASIYF